MKTARPLRAACDELQGKWRGALSAGMSGGIDQGSIPGDDGGAPKEFMNKRSLTVLVVEDHPTIARQIVDFLDGLKWQADHAATGAMAIHLAMHEIYDVVLLDLNLPDIDGLEVCRTIKAQAPRNVPVLMLTARDAFEDKARGFHGGADDYLTKPFDLRELALRCEALARRGQLHISQEMRVGPVRNFVCEA